MQTARPGHGLQNAGGDAVLPLGGLIRAGSGGHIDCDVVQPAGGDGLLHLGDGVHLDLHPAAPGVLPVLDGQGGDIAVLAAEGAALIRVEVAVIAVGKALGCGEDAFVVLLGAGRSGSLAERLLFCCNSGDVAVISDRRHCG